MAEAWESYVEAPFGTQRRPADCGFAHAATWPELLAAHDHWVAEHNDQDHRAHRDCPEDGPSPAAVLHRGCGKLFAPDYVRR